MKAAHFGAGNIGRGFIGQLLHEAGYHITFLDVNEDVVKELKKASSYDVIETGPGAKTHSVTNFSALNTNTELDAAVAAIAEAEVVTASVGVNVLKFVAPVIAKALEVRSAERPLIVMACENAIGATDLLHAEIQKLTDKSDRAIFANTAVDRIVPPKKGDASLDVVVEAFSEWLIDSSPFSGGEPTFPGARFVKDLRPYIERKLFTVNTGHASLAYLGQLSGASTIVESIKIPDVLATVTRVLAETSEVLISRHGFDPLEHAEYVGKTLERFKNTELDDPVERVGREPSRKLGRNDRLIAPAAYLAESGTEPVALLTVIEAALQFHDESDPQVKVLQEKMAKLSPEEFVSEVMGIQNPHPLAPSLTNRVKTLKSAASYSPNF